ncbi:protein of unknown function [Pararobbsia alpina]
MLGNHLTRDFKEVVVIFSGVGSHGFR